jgi:hypothetical protein
VYITWEGNRLYFVKSIDNGVTLSTKFDVTSETTAPIHPMMKKDGTGIYFSWSVSNETAFFRRSIDSGATFNATVTVHASTTHLQQVSMTATGTDIYVIWREQPASVETYDTYVAKSTNRGLSFSSPTNLSLSDSVSSTSPTIEALDDDVHLIWVEGSVITYLRSTNAGASWDNARELSTVPDITLAKEPLIYLQSQYIYILWVGFDDAVEVYLQTSSDNGDDFSGEINVSDTMEDESGYPSMFVVGGVAYVVFEDASDPGNDPVTDIYINVIGG